MERGEEKLANFVYVVENDDEDQQLGQLIAHTYTQKDNTHTKWILNCF